MILQSLITDKSYVSFDCAKTKVTKGSVIEIADRFYWEKEIQNAIKLGLIKVVGDVPTNQPVPEQKKEEKKIKLLCNPRVQGTIAFDCIKDFVTAGKFLWVPESRMDHPEIQNALDSGILQDPENKIQVTEVPIHTPVALHEVSVTQEEATSSTPRNVVSNRNRRRTRQATSPIRARPISRVRGSGDGEEGLQEIIGGESQIIAPEEPVLNDPSPLEVTPISIEATPVIEQQPVLTPSSENKDEQKALKEPKVIDSKVPFSFLDIFGE